MLNENWEGVGRDMYFADYFLYIHNYERGKYEAYRESGIGGNRKQTTNIRA